MECNINHLPVSDGVPGSMLSATDRGCNQFCSGFTNLYQPADGNQPGADPISYQLACPPNPNF